MASLQRHHCTGLVKGTYSLHKELYHAALLSMVLPALLLVTNKVLQMLDHSCRTATCCTDTMLALGEDMMGGRE